MNWAYYKPGPVPEAGLRILEVLERGTRQSNTRYRVRFDCCLFEDEITHKQIYDRIKRAARRCANCVGGRESDSELTFLGMSSRDHGVVPPAWPVPRVET